MPLCDICQISGYEWLHPYISQPQHFLLSGGKMKNNMVKIYTRPDNFKKYYMDIDEILPEVQMH